MKTSLLILISVLTMQFSGSAEFALWRSADGGDSWTKLAQSFNKRINALQFNGAGLLAATDGGVVLSGDRGRTWTHAGGAALQNERVVSLDSTGDITLIGTAEAGLWISKDGGRNARAVEQVGAKHIAALTHSAHSLYAGANHGQIFTSRDQGRSWTLLTNGLPALSQVFQLMAVGTNTVYAALYSKGLYALQDERWQRLGAVEPLAIAATRDIIFAGHNPGGVFLSKDLGTTWQPAQEGLPRRAPSWTLFTSGAQVYYGTTGTSGLYRLSSDGFSWQPAAEASFHNQAIVALAAQGPLMFAATVSTE